MNRDMKKLLISILSLVWAVSLSAQEWRKLPIPEADRDLICNLVRIMNMPQGTHKIYNGKGNTVFDVIYTIRCKKDEWTVYEGGTASVFDALYTITLSDKGAYTYRIYKGGTKSVFDILYSIEYGRDGMKIYKGDSLGVNLLYSYTRN